MIYVLSIIILVNIALGSVVLANNYRKPQNISFALLIFAICAWLLLNYFADASVNVDLNLLLTRLTMGAGILLAFFFYNFIIALSKYGLVTKYINYAYGIVSIILITASLKNIYPGLAIEKLRKLLIIPVHYFNKNLTSYNVFL